MSSKTTATTAEDFEETMINAMPDELKQVSAWLQECSRVDAQQCEMDDDKPPISLEKPPFPLEVKKAGSALAIQNYLESLTDVQKAFIKDIAKSPGFKVARTNTGRMSYSKPEPIYGEPWQDEASRKMKLNYGGTIKMMSSTPTKPGDDVIHRAWKSAVGSAVKSQLFKPDNIYDAEMPTPVMKSSSQPALDNEACWIGSSFHRELAQDFIKPLGRPDAILSNGDMVDIKLNSGGRAKTWPVSISKEAVKAMDDIHSRVLANMFSGEAIKDPYAAVMAANPGMKRRDVKDAYYRDTYSGVCDWPHNPQTEITARIMVDRINAGYDRKAGTFDTEVKPKSAKTTAFHAVLRKMTWRLSEMGVAFETWCSIGMSVVTGPWEERHD